ncbi:MAG: hypothetical protein B6I36_04405 [Desulfobacteraceae bacterium 4572_35.1]|nr:MAG: hypothetical protein B6I36_04405 [Desulfobacteraceae bacterium 4572_35.1]
MAINFAVQENPRGQSVLLMVILSVAVTCGLQLLFQVLGPFGVFLSPLLAFPIAYVSMRCGLVPALASLLIVIIFVTKTVGPMYGIAYVLQFGGASLVLPLLLRYGVGWFKALIVTLVLSATLLIAIAGIYTLKNDTTINAVVVDYVDSEVDVARQVYEKAELSTDQKNELFLVLDSTGVFFKQAYVGLSCVGLGVVMMATLVLLSMAARRHYIIQGVMFHELRLSEWLIWLLIVAGFSLMVDMAMVQRVALNMLTVLLPLYFLQGIAIVTFFLRKKAFSTASRVFVYMMILVINPLPLVVTAVGVFDMWFDFRKPRVKTT